MFLAVTASLLGYCQTDEKGKTQRRDSRPPFAYHISPPLSRPTSPSSLSLSSPYSLARAYVSLSTPTAAEAASKEIRISLSASSDSEGEGTREWRRARERAAKINFYGRRHE